MDSIQSIMTRRSVRQYTGEGIDEKDLKIILEAAMSGPSTANTRPWSFIVVRDKETLGKMAEANGKAANPLRTADIGILVCGDLSRAFPSAKDYWIIDCSIAAQNMTIAAHSLGLGSVWLGTYPQMDKVENQKKLFNLPEDIIPHSILSFGHPDPHEPSLNRAKFNEDQVHYEKW
ncbi:MAG: nitroreductase family protein [Eubacteriaceae bacterium]|nr:nitroreductase family protein [Eubacteriaceae bacterium]